MRPIHGAAVRTQKKKSRERYKRERLETIKISVAKRHKDGAYSKRTKKSRAKRGGADCCISATAQKRGGGRGYGIHRD